MAVANESLSPLERASAMQMQHPQSETPVLQKSGEVLPVFAAEIKCHLIFQM